MVYVSWVSDLGAIFCFCFFCSSAGLQERHIQGLASGDCCPPICANHINSDFKSEFHPFHLSSVIQRPIQRVAVFTSAHSASHLDQPAEFYNQQQKYLLRTDLTETNLFPSTFLLGVVNRDIKNCFAIIG